MKIGIIGFGNMGRMLAEVIAEDGLHRLLLNTRTKSRAGVFLQTHPQVRYFNSSASLVREADLIFVCVKPHDVAPLLRSFRDEFSGAKHLVSVSSCISLENLASVVNGKITRIIPTVISGLRLGVTLVCHNDHVDQTAKDRLDELLYKLGDAREIEERDFEAVADITSSGPGILSALFDEYIKAGVRQSTLSYTDTMLLFLKTVYGTSKMLLEQGGDIDHMISKVATKGGITEEGIRVVRKYLPGIINKVYAATLNKHLTVKNMVRGEF